MPGRRRPSSMVSFTTISTTTPGCASISPPNVTALFKNWWVRNGPAQPWRPPPPASRSCSAAAMKMTVRSTKKIKQMKLSYKFFFAFLLTAVSAVAQDDIYPAKPYTGRLFITGGTVHIGNGQVVDNATIEVNNGKIVRIGADVQPAGDAKIV